MTISQYGNPKRYQQPRKANTGEKKVAMSAAPSVLEVLTLPAAILTPIFGKAAQVKIQKSKSKHKKKFDKAKTGYQKSPSSVRKPKSIKEPVVVD